MITFLAILFILLTINVLLLIFSVNGASEMFKKPFRKLSDTPVSKLLSRDYSDNEYKEAV